MKIVPCLERKYLVSNPHISFLFVSPYLRVRVDSRKVCAICRIIFRFSMLGPPSNAYSTKFYEIYFAMYILWNLRNIRAFSTSLYSPFLSFAFSCSGGIFLPVAPPPPAKRKSTRCVLDALRSNSKGRNFWQSPLCKYLFDVSSK